MNSDRKHRFSPGVLAVVLGVFVVAAIGFMMANPGGPGAESGEPATEGVSSGESTQGR